MEIISYVGSRRDTHGNISSLLNTIVNRRTIHKTGEYEPSAGIYGLDFTHGPAARMRSAQHSSACSIAVPRFDFRRFHLSFSLSALFSSAGSLIEYTAGHIWAVIFVCACISTPFAVTAVRTYLDDFARPAAMESLPAQELEILNKAMADFALDTTDQLDSNGNILNDDGSVLKLSDVSFSKPVSYRKYTVSSGDTLLGITRKFGLTNISTLIAVNDIDNVRQLRKGQRLTVPSVDGILYTINKGDSLGKIASKYQVSVEDLLDVNDLSSHILSAGTQLFIPGAKLGSDAIRKAMGELFAYPLSVAWRLTSHFGLRPDPFTGVASHHTGIDMAVPAGTPIKASMSGKVIAVGFTNIYGNYVIINHGNGYQTLYAHMSKVLAHTGQEVSQGTRIGLVGSTGYSTGPHLHFTVYKNGKLIDPLSVLK